MADTTRANRAREQIEHASARLIQEHEARLSAWLQSIGVRSATGATATGHDENGVAPNPQSADVNRR